MKTENLIVSAVLYYVLAMLFGMCISWKYCGCEIMCMSFYYMARAVWSEMKGMLNDLKSMR